MAKKTFRVRLYRIQDYDLYSLYYDPFFPLRQAFCMAVTAYAEGLPAPRFGVDYVQDLAPGHPISVSCTFGVDSEKAIMMLKAASEHGNNGSNFAKLILRRSLVGIDRLFFNPDKAVLFRDIQSNQPPATDLCHIHDKPVESQIALTTKTTVPHVPTENEVPFKSLDKAAPIQAIKAPQDVVLQDANPKTNNQMKEKDELSAEIYSFIDGLIGGY